MRRARVAGILGAVALLASAGVGGADEKAKGEPASGWFPVAVEHRWQYTETTAEGEIRPVVFRVESTEQRADREVHIVAVTVFSDYEDEHGKVRKVGTTANRRRWTLAGGVPALVSESSVSRSRSFEPPVPMLADGLEVGASWTWAGKLTRKERGRADETEDARIVFEVEALEAVAVGDRKNPSYRVRETFEGATYHTLRWYAKGVGLVKEQVVAKDGRTRTLELTSFAPAKEGRP